MRKKKRVFFLIRYNCYAAAAVTFKVQQGWWWAGLKKKGINVLANDTFSCQFNPPSSRIRLLLLLLSARTRKLLLKNFSVSLYYLSLSSLPPIFACHSPEPPLLFSPKSV